MGLKIKPLLNKVSKNKFIQEYLKALGVEDIDLYLNPDSSCLDDAKFYPNMEKAANLLFNATTDKYKIGLLKVARQIRLEAILGVVLKSNAS